MEPSCAVPLRYDFEEQREFAGQTRPVFIITGGNVDLGQIAVDSWAKRPTPLGRGSPAPAHYSGEDTPMNAPTKFRKVPRSRAITSPPLSAWTRLISQTPALSSTRLALERNVKKMGDWAKDHGIAPPRPRQMHKSVDGCATCKMPFGGACGLCAAQKKSARPKPSPVAAFKDVSCLEPSGATPKKKIRPSGP